MKKIAFILLVLIIIPPSFGDVLIPLQEKIISENYLQKQFQKCTAEKPLLLGGGLCASCDTDDRVLLGCEKCPNRIKVNGTCYKKCHDDKQLLMLNGNCDTCDADGIGIYGYEKCNNRETIDGKCYKKCPDDKPLLMTDGNCETCDAKEIIYGGKFGKFIIHGCEKCPNTEMVNSKCYDKCPKDKPLRLISGKCVSCNTDDIGTSGYEKCTNREIIDGKGYKQCPDDKPIMTFDGNCVACNAIGKWDLVQSGCEKCNKKQDGKFCR